jgi:hypothetical protein
MKPYKRKNKNAKKKQYRKTKNRAITQHMDVTTGMRLLPTPRVNKQITVMRPWAQDFNLEFKNSALDDALSIGFSLSQTENFGLFQQLFDFYRIDAVYMTIRPKYLTQQTGITTGEIPNYVYCIDRDDLTLPLDYATLRGQSGARVASCLQTRKVAFTPNKINIIETSAGVGGGRVADVNYRDFIDLRQPSITHYGFKICNNSSFVQGLAGTFEMVGTVALKITFRCIDR